LEQKILKNLQESTQVFEKFEYKESIPLLAGLTDAGAGKRIAPGGGGRPPRDFAFVLVVPSPSFF